MDENMNVGLREEIIAELTVEFQNEPTFNAEILKIKVNDAYRKVKSRRKYENSYYSKEQIDMDLYEKYYQDIKDIAAFNFATMGAEFQLSHNENGVSRTWRTEDEILGNICAFVKIF